jgi:hypothetical protein
VLATCDKELAGGANKSEISKKAVTFMQMQKAALEAVLQKARNSMAVLSMLSSSNKAIIDVLPSLGRLTSVLCPQAGAEVECGPAMLAKITASLELCSKDDIAAFDLSFSAGDYRLASHACDAIRNITGDSLLGLDGKPALIDDKRVAVTAATVDSKKAHAYADLLSGMISMVQGSWDGGSFDNKFFYSAAQSAVDAIFAIAPRPVDDCEAMLAGMAASIRSSDGAPRVPALARFFFVLGHVSLKLLILLDSLAMRVKALRVRAYDKKSTMTASESAEKGAKKGKDGKVEAGSLEDQLGANAAEDEKVCSARRNACATSIHC